MQQKDSIEIKPTNGLNSEITAPPSKAYTLRALFISSLCDGRSVLKNALYADDQKSAADCLGKLGASIEFKSGDFVVQGNSGHPKAAGENLFVGDSGVTARFICAYASLAEGRTFIDGSERIRERPVGELISSLNKLGVKSSYLSNENFLPVQINGKSLRGGKTAIDAQKSSQYVSAILIAAPYADKDVEISIKGKIKSEPYVDITLQCMKDFGVSAKKSKGRYFVKAGQEYKARDYAIEGDYSSASYFFAAAAITKGRIKVKNLKKDSAQPDSVLPKLLEKMGCKVNYDEKFIEVYGKELKGIEVNMKDSPDVVPTLAVVAAFAKGKTIIKGVEHLRLKESDRIKSVVSNLQKMGVDAKEAKDGMAIRGNPDKIRAIEVETFDDHRIAMAFAMAGLAGGGMKIKNPDCVNKSFPDFFRVLSSIGD